MKMPLTAAQVQEYLNEGDAVLLPSSNPDENTLTVDIAMTIPSGRTLELSEGIDVAVGDDFYITVDGSMTGKGTLTISNGGQLIVNDSGILEMPAIDSHGTIINNRNGRIVTENLTTNYMFSTAGAIEGTVTHSGGEAAIVGGTVTNGLRYVDGEAEEDAPDRLFEMENGTITASGGAEAALLVEGSQGSIRIFGGTIDGGSKPAIMINSSSVPISIGDMSDGSNAALIRSNSSNSVIQFGGTGQVQYVSGAGSSVTGNIPITAPDGGGSYRLTGVSNDIAGALGGAKNGEIVTLPGNLSADAGSELLIGGGTEDSPVVLDLNGYTLDVTAPVVVSGVLKVCGSGSGGTWSVGSRIQVARSDSAHLILDGGTITGGDGFTIALSSSSFTMDGGEIISPSSGIAVILCDPGTSAKLELNGGTITNEGTGNVLYVSSGERPNVTVGNTVVRSRGNEFFVYSDEDGLVQTWWPEGCVSASGPDEGGWYELVKT